MALTVNWRERSIVDAGGHTGNSYYMRKIGRDGYVWNPITETMVLHSAITWAVSAEALVEDGLTGIFPITISPNIPASTYDVIIYNRATGVALNTDDVEKQFQAKLGGDIFGF